MVCYKALVCNNKRNTGRLPSISKTAAAHYPCPWIPSPKFGKYQVCLTGDKDFQQTTVSIAGIVISPASGISTVVASRPKFTTTVTGLLRASANRNARTRSASTVNRSGHFAARRAPPRPIRSITQKSRSV